MKTKLIFSSLSLLLSSFAFSGTSVVVGEENAAVTLEGQEALNLWNYLQGIREYNGFVIEDHSAGHTHLSTPSFTCTKTNEGNFDPPKEASDPSLYTCELTINKLGLVEKN